MRILIIAPMHDYPTTLSTQAVMDLIRFMNENRIEYNVLRFVNANRILIDLLPRLKHFDGLFYFGHGDEDRLGDWMMPLIPLIDQNNIGLFKDSIIYTMACLSGRELGEKAIEKGVKSYFGHMVRYFAFVEKLGLQHNFLNDWIDLVTFIPKRLMLGDTTGIALSKYEKYSNFLYSKYLGLDKEINLKLLYGNALHLELFGNRTATLYD